jgi:beta-lactamase class A
MSTLAVVKKSIDGLIQALPGRVGLVVKDLEAGESLAWLPDERFPAASVIKIPVLIEAFRQAEANRLSLDERILIQRSDRVGGFGILKELSSVEAVSLLDLLTLMIVISDNTAANLCIRRVGMDAVNETMATLGLRATVLQREMMDMAARERGLDNFTSAADAARMLELLATDQILTPENSARALAILFRQQVNDRLPLLLPPVVRVAHKTGELPGIRHDVGVLFLDNRRVVVAALTKDLATPLGQGLVGGEASALIAKVARQVFESIAEGCAQRLDHSIGA